MRPQQKPQVQIGDPPPPALHAATATCSAHRHARLQWSVARQRPENHPRAASWRWNRVAAPRGCWRCCRQCAAGRRRDIRAVQCCGSCPTRRLPCSCTIALCCPFSTEYLFSVCFVCVCVCFAVDDVVAVPVYPMLLTTIEKARLPFFFFSSSSFFVLRVVCQPTIVNRKRLRRKKKKAELKKREKKTRAGRGASQLKEKKKKGTLT